MYVTILAGGGGTRLWPKSRIATPKQFLKLAGHRSLLQATADRLLPLVGWQDLYVVTCRDYAAQTFEHLPELPAENLIVEPMGRGTAIAIGLAAARIAHHAPDAIMASIGSDHLIADPEEFRRCLNTARKAAEQGDYLVTIGVRPTSPHTGYGYIRTSVDKIEVDGQSVFRVEGFKEKPDRATAEGYLRAGSYLWNTNYFVWSVKSILSAFRRQAPGLYEGLTRITAALGTQDEERVIGEVYASAAGEAIDTAIMEKATNILSVPGEFGWSDVGSWGDVYPVAHEVGGNYLLEGSEDQVVAVDSQGCLFQSAGRLIAVVGLQDMVVVEMPDVLLVCPRNRCQDVRQVVEQLRRLGREEFS